MTAPDEIAERALIEISRWQREAWEAARMSLPERKPYDEDKILRLSERLKTCGT